MTNLRSLPTSPDLRFLREEAKLRCRSGEFESLAVAQLAIAREFGFRTWPRLKLHVDGLTLDVAERAALLLRSATSADLRGAQAMLAADPEVARYDLACACACGEVEYVTQILEADPARADAPTGLYQWPPILYACFSRLLRGDRQRSGQIREVVWRLLVAGADPNAYFIKDDWLQVALYGAAGIAGDSELTRMLLEAGAEPTDDREGYHGNEVLYHACEFPDPTCARLVIEAGARKDFVSRALGRALNFPNHEMIEMFCAHGAKPTADHLRQAVWRRRPPRTIITLIDAGAPINEPDENGLTALRIAVCWGETTIAQILRNNGADETIVSDQERALGRYLSGERVAFSVDRSLADKLLMLSIETGHLEPMRRLLDAGAIIDGDPESDQVPLGNACWRGRVQAVRELVERGAALEFPDGGSAIAATLHGARHCHDPEGGPSMRTTDEVPKTPYAEILRILMAAGAVVPDRVGDGRQRTTMLLAELGIDRAYATS
jgi:ankyrin repeat protein